MAMPQIPIPSNFKVQTFLKTPWTSIFYTHEHLNTWALLQINFHLTLTNTLGGVVMTRFVRTIQGAITLGNLNEPEHPTHMHIRI
jgi:hypothetical protein